VTSAPLRNLGLGSTMAVARRTSFIAVHAQPGDLKVSSHAKVPSEQLHLHVITPQGEFAVALAVPHRLSKCSSIKVIVPTPATNSNRQRATVEY
jgi:hypothetical protein